MNPYAIRRAVIAIAIDIAFPVCVFLAGGGGCGGGALLCADVVLAPLFRDGAVLQRDQPVPVWGTARAGESITVRFGGHTVKTRADVDSGRWQVMLPVQPASSQPRVLVVRGGGGSNNNNDSNSNSNSNTTVRVRDVLVGDVWLASGQSNMEFGIQGDSRGRDAIAKAGDPQLRLFFVPRATALEPQTALSGERESPREASWQSASPDVLGAHWGWKGFSAVAYYFGQDIRRATGVPVGIVEACKGGTPAEAWTSLDTLRREQALAHYVKRHEELVAGYPRVFAEWPGKQAAYRSALARWESGDRTAVPRPRAPLPPDGGFRAPGNAFNAMIAPLVPYGIKGVIWYQGETNGDNLAKAREYAVLFPRLIEDWRSRWGADFPFLFVQLAGYRAVAREPSGGNWPWVREAQLRALSLPKTGMASAIDLGDAADIHPANKLDVALRLALAARHVAYGETLVYCGPVYDSARVEGRAVRVVFRQCGGGLMAGIDDKTGAELTGFGIAGADRKFVWARAVIEGDTVLVSNEAVQCPVSVRYGWADNPSANLYNKEGLPASPFRTDDW